MPVNNGSPLNLNSGGEEEGEASCRFAKAQKRGITMKVAREVARMDRRCSNSSSTASTTYEKWDGGPCSASLQRKVPRTFGEGAARRE